MQSSADLVLLIFAVLLCAGAHYVTVHADTKVLHTLSLYQPGYSSRDEVISLNNVGSADEDLVINGNYTIQFGPANALGLIFKQVLEYIADKNGNRVHFRIMTAPLVQSRLSPAALMSAAG